MEGESRCLSSLHASAQTLLTVISADYGGGLHAGDSQGDYYSEDEDFLGSDEDEEDPEGFPHELPRMRTLTVHNYN